MPDLPINKRPFRTFLSHAHVDKSFVDKLYSWLTDFADVKVWYDSVQFPSGLVASELGKAIENCQSAIIVLSADSIESGWVEEEWNICIEQQKSKPDFQIVLLNLDGCTPPSSLRVRKWIDVRDHSIAPEVACQVVEALHWYATRPSEIDRSTFYLSRGSRASEVEKSEQILSACRANGCRFVRDSPDQFKFDEVRIKHIIASTSGIFAFVPNRGEGSTSKYILDEILFAKEMNVPALIVVDPGISKTTLEEISPKRHVIIECDAGDGERIYESARDFAEHAPAPMRGAHCFIGHPLDADQRETWAMARRVAQAVAGLPCLSGNQLSGDHAQGQIVEKIRTSAMSIFDISDENKINTFVEAGIAIGAGAKYQLVCRGARHRPPFIFRDKEVFFYETPAELLGLVRRFTLGIRRVVT